MVSDTSDSILKCKKQNTVIVFLEIPSSKASAHPRHLFAGSLHKCWCGYTWVLLVIFLGMGVNVGVPCVYGIFYSRPFYSDKRRRALLGTGLFSMIRVIFHDSIILGEDF